MKKNIVSSYFSGLIDAYNGESYGAILRYFFPEFITNLLIYSMPFWIDAVFIGALSSTEAYVALGITNGFIHLLIKTAEAFSVGTVVLSGKLNGKNKYKEAGRALVDSFWMTTILGIAFSILLYIAAPFIYPWYGVQKEVSVLGVPFLRARAIGVLCMFMYFALVGFMRGIKNTRTPMKIFMCGAIVFIFFDYALIFGKFGFAARGLQGSAIATCIQYGVMLIISVLYMVYKKKLRRYSIVLLEPFKDWRYVIHLAKISLPVLIDKTTMAMAYVWLGKMIAKMGTCGTAAFCVVKDMERFAFLPAIAFAQVITLLVSNDVGACRWDAIKTNIKKIIFLALCMVALILVFFSYNAAFIIEVFDRKGEFTGMAKTAFPILSVLVIFDVLQIILSGALRGSGNMYVVTVVRFVICLFYFCPFSYILSTWDFQDEVTKFIAIYGAFYVGNAFMSIAYVYWFRRGEWKKTTTIS